MQGLVLQGLRNDAYRNNITILSEDVPFDLFEIMKLHCAPDYNLYPVKGGSILEEFLQDNDQNPSHPSE